MQLDLQTARKALTNISTNAPANDKFTLNFKNKSGFTLTMNQLKNPQFLESGSYDIVATQINSTTGESEVVLTAELLIEENLNVIPEIKQEPIPQIQQVQTPPPQPQSIVSPDFILQLRAQDQANFANERKLYEQKFENIETSHRNEIQKLSDSHKREIESLREIHKIEIDNLKTINQKVDDERAKIRESLEAELRRERKVEARAGKKSVWDVVAEFVEKNPDDILAFIRSKESPANNPQPTRSSALNDLADAMKEAQEATRGM